MQENMTINKAEMSQSALESGSCVFIILSHHQKFLLFSKKKGFFPEDYFSGNHKCIYPLLKTLK